MEIFEMGRVTKGKYDVICNQEGYDVTGSQVPERVAQTGLRLVRAFTRFLGIQFKL